MKGKLLAAVLAVTTAFAVPALAESGGTASSTTSMPSPGAMHPGMHDRGMGHEMWHGRMHRWGPGMGSWQAARWADPKERCIDRLARRAARLAYIETKLDLTAAQRPLWDKLEEAANREAHQERQLCDSLKTSGPRTMLDRIDHMEQFLTVRLNGMKAAKPDLEALYKALTPEQKAIMDHPYVMR